MGKPRLIILIRHAQSEGNLDRAIHQVVPDHRVKLTQDGWQQAAEAGSRLREMLRPDDTIQFYTSPYRRTRETTEGILRTLTAREDPERPDMPPSPFDRSRIKVYEEPRLREQDWGNFQPNSNEMERMWRERAEYGHFFYRIPNGESAADAYDRISGFNESLWRQFGEQSFPSVCVLVTHGLMTRVFLMKWYHWSVEYFEDLRNINHCEFIIMKQNLSSGKFILQNELRTWSQLKRIKAEQEEEKAHELIADLQRRNTLSHFLKEHNSHAIQSLRQGKARNLAETSSQSALLESPIAESKSSDTVTGERIKSERSHPTFEKSEMPTPKITQDTSPPPHAARSKPFHRYTPSPHDLLQSGVYPFEQSLETTISPGDTSRRSLASGFRERSEEDDGEPVNPSADTLGDSPAPTAETDDAITRAEEFDRSFRGSVY